MRLIRALHLSVISVVFVAALSLTIDTLASDEVTSLSVRTVDDTIVQCCVFVYLVFTVCLIVYALKRRYPRRAAHSV
jgi:hypothetical protein